MDKYTLKVAGVTYDGRQNVIAGLSVRDKLYFKPEPDNEYDNYAVGVYTKENKSVGYISRNVNEPIFKNIMNDAVIYDIEVSTITGGCGYNYGLEITVTETENEYPDENIKLNFKFQALRAKIDEDMDKEIFEKVCENKKICMCCSKHLSSKSCKNEYEKCKNAYLNWMKHNISEAEKMVEYIEIYREEMRIEAYEFARDYEEYLMEMRSYDDRY